MYYLISKSAQTRVMLRCVKSMFFCAVRFTRNPKSALRSCTIQYYLTDSHAQEGYITVALAVQFVSYQGVKQHNTNQRDTPITESEFWCNIPKSYIIIVVFTFDVGYWSQH
jgi:hypothetical protein